MIWVVWFLFTFGLVYLVVGASITKWPRRFLFNLLGPHWGGWLACAPCASFWIGVAVGLPEIGVVAALLPGLLIVDWIVIVAARVTAGVIVMGGVALAQFATGVLFAELGAAARAAQEKEGS